MDNSQLRVYPFYGEKPVIEHEERYYKVHCRNFYCDVQPRTSWCYNLEYAVEIWKGKTIKLKIGCEKD